MLLAAAALAACQQQEPSGDRNVSVDPTPKLPSVPLPQPPLNREQLLLGAMRSASDFAAGIDDSQRQKDLAERRFEFRIRFGCEEPGSEAVKGPFGWSLNENTRALSVRATPTLLATDAAVEAIAGERFEAVEGFWIQRPWLLSAICPQAKPASNEAAKSDGSARQATGNEPARNLAIAQFFTATDPRTMRRSGRPYQATVRLDEGDKPAGGFDLLLAGRLKALPDGRVIACTRSSTGGQPICLISVEFGRVSIERADTHAELAHWGAG